MYDKCVLECFLEKQGQLYDEKVAYDLDEAAEFLEDCMAFVVNDYKELAAYFEENADVVGMSKDEILSQGEVFTIPDGRYLIVEA